MKPLLYFFSIILLLPTPRGLAQNKPAARGALPEVEWYPPETEKSGAPNRARVVITGKTSPAARVQIDGESVSVLSPNKQDAATGVIDSPQTRANFEGFFEIAMDLPQGLAQIPVLITSQNNSQKTFLISVNVKIVKNNVDEVGFRNTKVSTKKPPAAAKRFRLWAGAGGTFQNYNQSTSGSADLSFQTIQAPGLMLRGGYWGEAWGLDLYFRDAPGVVEAASPLVIEKNSYHWRTMEAKGLYQISRGPSSRLWRLPAQWQVRFGTQSHQVPFLVNSNNVITIQDLNITTATLGLGLLLGQEQNWSYEMAFGLQQPLSSSSSGAAFSMSSQIGYEAQLGAAYKFAPNWRIGIFSYTQSMSYQYEYEASGTSAKIGKQNLFYTTFDFRLGYEF